MVGASDLSAPLSAIAASVPDLVASFTNDLSATNGQQIKVTWVAPFNGGSQIIQYYLTYVDASDKNQTPTT
jgi:hypothetical protein